MIDHKDIWFNRNIQNNIKVYKTKGKSIMLINSDNTRIYYDQKIPNPNNFLA